MKFEDGSGNRLLILHELGSFYLLDENNNQLAVDIVTEIDTYYNICCWAIWFDENIWRL